jgi:hypothetical protein
MILFRFLAPGVIFLYFISSTILSRAQENLSAMVKRIEPSTVVALAYDKDLSEANKYAIKNTDRY